jgi:enolase
VCVIGVYEALELRDGGSDYLGKGVLKVCLDLVHSLEGIFSLLCGISHIFVVIP